MRKLELKNSEGFDRIPQKILVDRVDILSIPLHKLLNFKILGEEGTWTVACLQDYYI
jgi:hypothetical protein